MKLFFFVYSRMFKHNYLPFSRFLNKNSNSFFCVNRVLNKILKAVNAVL